MAFVVEGDASDAGHLPDRGPGNEPAMADVGLSPLLPQEGLAAR